MKKFVKGLCRLLFCKLFYRVKYIGLENIDLKEGKVYCVNHVSAIDPIIVGLKIDGVRIMAKEELFKNKLVAKFITAFGAFPIKRGKKDFGHLLYAVKLVKKNENLLIFPEGTRKAKQKNVKAKNGATYIAAVAGAKVVPVHITENMRLFGKVEIEYKKPIELELTKEDLKDKEKINEATERIMKSIYGN